MGKRRGVSRRGLLGLFGRGLREFREAIDHADGAPAPGRGAAAPFGSGPSGSAPSGSAPTASAPGVEDFLPDYDRLLRPAEEVVRAVADGPDAWTVTLPEPLATGASVVVAGGDLPEHLILVRVHDTHLAAASSECPVDGSDLIWRGQMDCVACPSCGSMWRLDGEVLGGPGDTPIARFVVDESGPAVRISSTAGGYR